MGISGQGRSGPRQKWGNSTLRSVDTPAPWRLPLAMEARHLLKALKDEGWFLGDTHGPVRQYIHTERPGVVITVCVRYTDELGPGALASAQAPGPARADADHRVVIEAAGSGASAYSPDLPGCIATGEGEVDARERMADAMRLHVQGLRAR
jgi:predicted RNA binding protein YcfA (HicA-like mRNA interferase family)